MRTDPSLAVLGTLCLLCASCEHGNDAIPKEEPDHINYVDVEPHLHVGCVLSTGPNGVLPPDSSATLSLALWGDSALIFSATTTHWHEQGSPTCCDNYYMSVGFNYVLQGKVAVMADPGGVLVKVLPLQENGLVSSALNWDAGGTVYWDEPSVPDVPTYHDATGTFYIGLQVQINDETHYGWMQVNRTGSTLTIKSYAVNAGSTGSILAGRAQ